MMGAGIVVESPMEAFVKAQQGIPYDVIVAEADKLHGREQLRWEILHTVLLSSTTYVENPECALEIAERLYKWVRS